MKIKVGNYVRTKGSTYVGSVLEYLNVPRIDKVSCFDTLDKDDYFYLEQDPSGDMYCEEDIIKHGENITDVIEVGDYVNGFKVSFVDEEPVLGKFVQCDYPVQYGSTNHYRFYEPDIDSILTKEQFERMEYIRYVQSDNQN